MENEKSKIWLGEDGIIRIETGKDIFNSEKITIELVSEFKKIAKTLPNKANILVNIKEPIPISNFFFRKKVIELVKDAFEDPGFNKFALWGAGNNILKTVALFIIGATKLSNFKYFDTEKEALKWFNEK